jgi:leader peptidase (prepilin peptidase) / N-methyltransferase
VLPPLFLDAACFLFGLVIGSFLNVVIARLPDGRSVVHPPSACPACGSSIRWYDNVPVLSWLWLRGRSRACRAVISWRYPAAELLTAVLFALAARQRGPALYPP